MNTVVVYKQNSQGILEDSAESIIDVLEQEIQKATTDITESHTRHGSAHYVGKKHGLEIALELIRGQKQCGDK